MYLTLLSQRATGDETFKDYYRYVVKYKQDDVSFAPWMLDFAQDVIDDKSFPRKTRYRNIIYNSHAYDYYKKAIEEYLEKKANDVTKEAFQLLWRMYVSFEWLDEKSYDIKMAKQKAKK